MGKEAEEIEGNIGIYAESCIYYWRAFIFYILRKWDG